MTPVEFRGDLWLQKTRVPGLSCSVVCVILRLAVLVEHRLVTDRQTDRRTDGQRDRDRAMASKNSIRWFIKIPMITSWATDRVDGPNAPQLRVCNNRPHGWTDHVTAARL